MSKWNFFEDCKLNFVNLEFLFGIIIGFTFMYQLRVQAEKRCEVLQEEVNLLKEVIIKEQK